MMKRPDKKDAIFTAIILLVHVAFFLLACSFRRIYMGDSFEYIYEAVNIKNYFFFYSGNPAMPILPEYMTQRQPGYPLFLLLTYLFTVNNWIVIVLQNLLSVFNICYLRKTIAHIGYQKKNDWLLLLLLVAYPAQFINANTIAPDILLQTCTLLYVANFIFLLQQKTLKYALHMSLWLSAGLMVKPVLYPFALFHFVIILLASLHHRAKLQRPMLAAILPLCVVLLYNFWNYNRTGKFHFSSNQAFNAVYYYYPFLSQSSGADSANHFLSATRRELDAIPEFSERYDYANEQGLQLLKTNFVPYMLFHLKNSLRIFIEPGKAEIDLFTGKLSYGRLYSKEQTGFYATLKSKGWRNMGSYLSANSSLIFVILILIFNVVRLIGLVYFFVGRSTPLFIKYFISILLLYFALAAGPIANTRYFLPVSLLAIGCAAVGISEQRKHRPTQY